MRGIGRECGNDNNSPRCNRRSNRPAAFRAVAENGGVLISPESHISDLPRSDID
jgi:hypothetical protein